MIKEKKLTVWGREFILPIEYDCYEGESITKEQIKALKKFLSHLEWLDKAKEQVEDYCREAVYEDDGNQKKDNIFSYIKPETLYVTREDNPVVALMCKYRYDMEHGLAVAFSQTGEVAVGLQDMVI